ncbi:hypothetical protein FQN54_006762 [Arachnomyces sp. PD_36]|nr:hypothetical protein FQN54_006762 [Arachnomyces sp. PD_36]
MPCENCAALGTSCSYSVAGRQGRPRGSSRRNNSGSGHGSSNTTSNKPWHTSVSKPAPAPPTPTPTLIQSSGAGALGTMLGLSVDGFDPMLSYNLALNWGQETSEGSTLDRLYSTPEGESLSSFESLPMLGSSSLSSPTSDNNTPLLASAMNIEQPNQQQNHQQEHPHATKQQPNIQIHELLRQHSHRPQPNDGQPFPSRNNPPPDCDCIPRLSALLQDIKRPAFDQLSSVRFDGILARVSNALTQWSHVLACQRCQEYERNNDDDETLLLAAMSMRRIVVQLKEGGFWLEPARCGGGTEDSDEVELRIGDFQVTGADRAMLLSVLRTITVRKLDAAVTTMQSWLRTKQERQGEERSATLHHVESILQELSKTIKS